MVGDSSGNGDISTSNCVAHPNYTLLLERFQSKAAFGVVRYARSDRG